MKNSIIRFTAALLAGCAVFTVSCGDNTPGDQDPNKLKSITMEQPSPQTVTVGQIISLSVTADPATASLADLRWSTRETEFATVNENGNVKGVKVGAATIVASCGGIRTSCEVNVVAAPVPLQKIEIAPASVSIKIGNKVTVEAKLIPGHADVEGNPVWESLDPDIAEVDQEGVVTARAEGRTTVTATLGGVTGSCSVGVYAETVDRPLTFFQFNIWEGLANVNNGVKILIDHLVALTPDVASFCEFRSADEAKSVLAQAAEGLEQRTGIPYYFTCRSGSGTRGLLTRHPVLSTGAVGNNAWFYRTVIDFYGREIALYASHSYFSYYSCYLPRGYGDGEPPYGWDKIAGGPITDVDFILEREEKSRRYEIADAMVADMAAQQADGRLCIFGGDLNQPSHLDWTEEAKDRYEHGGCVVPWPVSTICYANGIRDAFREVYPDPVTHPGVTWPVYNKDTEKVTQWCAEADERDRIDYIYFKQDPSIEAVKAQMVGPSAMVSHSAKVEEPFVDPEEELIEPLGGVWPSDHRGVFVTFNVKFSE